MIAVHWGIRKREGSAHKARVCISGGRKKSSVSFAKSFWEETEKQKTRSCRAQELARSCAQENERQKRWMYRQSVIPIRGGDSSEHYAASGPPAGSAAVWR